ncbi:MAG: SulP family inorganic anion transporter [Gammaproteobacteria bacterium]|nr:SulP family inorganic anion transporter [Gammaproteobacteria bacterium]
MHVNWRKWFPFLEWLSAIDGQTMRADLVAGLTNAVMVLPQGVAFALIAGLPPEYGLYSAIVPTIIASFFGSSLHMVSGPTTALSILIFASMSNIAAPMTPYYIELVLLMTLMAGMIQFAFGVARLGRLVNFVSHNVIVGFTSGAAILIASSQITHVFGVELEGGKNIIFRLVELEAHFADVDWRNPVIAFIALVTAVISRKITNKVPNMLIGMLFGSVAGILLDPNATLIRYVSELPRTLPAPYIPDMDLQTLSLLAPSAFVVAVIGLIEAVSIGRAIGVKSRQRIDGDQEFIGQGLSNIFGSLFSAYASSGSFTRSGVNYEAGAKTPLASLIAAVLLMGILLFIAPLAKYLNYPTMGGIIMLVAWNLLNLREIKEIFRAGRSEWGVLVTTFFATVFTNLEFAVLSGVMLSLVFYLNRTARPKIIPIAPNPDEPKRRMGSVHLNDLQECPQAQIAAVNGSIFFGAVQHTADSLARLRKVSPQRTHLLLQMDGVNFFDLEGAKVFATEAQVRTERGGKIYLSGLKDEAKSQLRRFGVIDAVGEENIFRSKTDAVETMVENLDADICSRCQARIFRECAYRPVPGDYLAETVVERPRRPSDYILDT